MTSRLPNAPLTEVIFEMHWKLAPHLGGMPLATDPGYGSVFDAIAAHAKKNGFDRHQDFQPPYTGLGRGVSRRFYQGKNEFPLLQIGPGLFAANDSVNYEWEPFKKMAIGGALLILQQYPDFKDFNLEITRLELRYLDAFEESLVGSSDLFEFINKGTEATVELPGFWDGDMVGREKRGRLQIESDVKHLNGAKFVLDLASAKKNDAQIIRMETKIISDGEKILPNRQLKRAATWLDNWLTKAHDVTSSSFKALISKEVFSKFEK